MPKIRYILEDVLHTKVRIIKKDLEKLGAIQVSSGITRFKKSYINFSVKELKIISELKNRYPNIIEVRH